MCKELQIISVEISANFIRAANTFYYSGENIDILFTNRNVLLKKVTMSWFINMSPAFDVDDILENGISFQLLASDFNFVTFAPATVLNQTAGAIVSQTPAFTLSSNYGELNLNVVCQGVSLYDQFIQADLDSSVTDFDLKQTINFHFENLEN